MEWISLTLSGFTCIKWNAIVLNEIYIDTKSTEWNTVMENVLLCNGDFLGVGFTCNKWNAIILNGIYIDRNSTEWNTVMKNVSWCNGTLNEKDSLALSGMQSF